MLDIIDFYAENPIVGKTLRSCFLENNNVYDDINGNNDIDWTITNNSRLSIVSSNIKNYSPLYDVNWEYGIPQIPPVIYGASTIRLNGSSIKIGNIDSTETGACAVEFLNVGQLKIPGGVNGDVITTDGSGNLSWNNAGSSGSSTQIVTDPTIPINITDTTSVLKKGGIYKNFLESYTPPADGYIKQLTFAPDPFTSERLATVSAGSGTIQDWVNLNNNEIIISHLGSGDLVTYNTENPTQTGTTIVNSKRIFKFNHVTKTFTSVGDFNAYPLKLKKDSLGRVWAIGNFTSIDGVFYPSRIAIYDGTTWSSPFINPTGISFNSVNDIVIDNPSINSFWAVGNFNEIGGTTCYQNYYYNGTSAIPGWGTSDHNATSDLFIEKNGNYLYVGGRFTSFSGSNYNYIYRVNITTNAIESLPGYILNGRVTAFAIYNNNIVFSGEFNNTTPFVQRIAQFDGSNVVGLSLGMNAGLSATKMWVGNDGYLRLTGSGFGNAFLSTNTGGTTIGIFGASFYEPNNNAWFPVTMYGNNYSVFAEALSTGQFMCIQNNQFVFSYQRALLIFNTNNKIIAGNTSQGAYTNLLFTTTAGSINSYFQYNASIDKWVVLINAGVNMLQNQKLVSP